jgi:ribosome-associated protein
LISKPSKSALKREFQALQELGEQLIELTDEQLSGIDLEESLRNAVVAARSIKAHGALRRQKQLIGKLMRRVDPEPIRAALNALGADDRRAKRIFTDAEQWRDRLRDGGDDAIDAFKALIGRECPAVAGAVRDCRNAVSDRDRKAASRRLFREIHREIEGNVQKASRSI